MTDYADLEIGLHARDGVSWRVELRYSQPRADVETRLDSRGAQFATIDPDALEVHADDDEAYGLALGQALFEGSVGDGYRQCKAAAQALGITMRVRLFVGPSAPRLHAVRWETIRDVDDGSPLLTDEAVVFSRYLSSNDWRPVGLRPKSQLRAVALVANPSDAADFGPDGLAPIDVDREVTTARQGLSPLPTRVLAGRKDATLDRLFDALRDGCDILYLVCHGYLAGGAPVLLFEDDDGHGVPIRGVELVERIRDLVRMPRLVVLASCQSAGAGEESRSNDGGALAALGPRLAEAGVPAVVAMQGNVSMQTVSRFMPVLFRELQRDGQVDRAMAAARGTVRDRPDWWVPTLFMRLRSGRIWYQAGFGGSGEAFEKFPALISEIRDQKCTPILGPGLNDQLLGPRQEIAQRWAKHFRFPMAPQWRDDLPQVAQFLSVNLGPNFPRDELGNYLRTALLANYEELAAAYAGQNRNDIALGPLMSQAWQIRYPEGSDDPYAFLAELPLPLYVTTQPWNLLADALRRAGKDPQIELCRWKRLDSDDPWGSDEEFDTPDWAFATFDDVDRRREAVLSGWPTSVFDREPSYRPTKERPLVFHLFGHHARRRTLVLTEDDYFVFLIGITRDKDLVPLKVRRAFSDTSLMLLGQPELGFDTRVIYQSILNQEGDRRREHTHVAVQIDPEESRSVDPNRARKYLETYFQSSNFTIYWGSTDAFIKELRDAWRAAS